MDAAARLESLRAVAATQAGLRGLILFGSRARGDAAATADWDFGYLADPSFDPASLVAAIVRIVGTEDVDLVDLSNASGLLRFRAARDGHTVWGDAPVIEQFRIEAASFWCDAEPILRSAYDAVLERM